MAALPVPPALRQAFERRAVRPAGPDLTALEAAVLSGEGWDDRRRIVRALGGPADDVIGRALSPLFRCALWPRGYLPHGGPAAAELYPPGVPDEIAADEVTVLDAYFLPALGAAHFAQETLLEPHHMPAVRLAVSLVLPLDASVVDAWTDARGRLSVELLERWERSAVDLVSLLQWELRAPVRDALPERFGYYLGGHVLVELARVPQ